MIRIFYLLCLSILFVAGCKDDSPMEPERFENALPKRVKLYHPLSSASDSLMLEYEFYWKNASHMLDSFSMKLIGGMEYDMHVYDTGEGYYNLRIEDMFIPSFGFYREESGYNMYRFVQSPLGCDGASPSDSYGFEFNTDNSVKSYSRNVTSERCGGRSDDAFMEYKMDTLIVKNVKDVGFVMDTIVYLGNEMHYSNLPVLSFLYGRLFNNFGQNLFTKLPPVMFVPVSAYQHKLIHKVISDGFESRYVYTFNENNNVARLDMFIKEKPDMLGEVPIEYHIKFIFEY